MKLFCGDVMGKKGGEKRKEREGGRKVTRLDKEREGSSWSVRSLLRCVLSTTSKKVQLGTCVVMLPLSRMSTWRLVF